MSLVSRAASTANNALGRLGVQLVRRPSRRPWDEVFDGWISSAREAGADPNDVGDQAWGDPRSYIERAYLPYIGADSVVLEVGPGSGRVTRHLIGRCREMILVDYSPRVCRWLSTYLQGRGSYSVHEISGPSLPMIADEAVDVVVSYGVFEHVGFDDTGWFLEEFHRVLRPGGVASFNFDDIMLPDGLAWYRANRGRPGDRCLFRFYHPEVMARLAEAAGFAVEELTEGGRTADIRLRKPVRPGA